MQIHNIPVAKLVPITAPKRRGMLTGVTSS
ncbi:hypothetical protein SAMN05216604_101177 [Pseudomonas agarici]|nr:hypothetical protein SAMN05216604_101177 [Pseudomonas agarici]